MHGGDTGDLGAPTTKKMLAKKMAVRPSKAVPRESKGQGTCIVMLLIGSSLGPSHSQHRRGGARSSLHPWSSGPAPFLLSFFLQSH